MEPEFASTGSVGTRLGRLPKKLSTDLWRGVVRRCYNSACRLNAEVKKIVARNHIKTRLVLIWPSRHKTPLAALDKHKTNHLQRDNKSRRGKVAAQCQCGSGAFGAYLTKHFRLGNMIKVEILKNAECFPETARDHSETGPETIVKYTETQRP